MANENNPQTVILGLGVELGNSKEKLQELGNTVKGTGEAISNAADVAAAALERQGAAQEAAAKASKRSTDSAVRTLQTEIAAREAGGRATARYYELIYAGSTKVDQQAIAPLIARYKALEEQQKAAGEAAKKRAEEEKQAAKAAADAIKSQAEALRASQAVNDRILASKAAGGGSVAGLPDISSGTRQLEQMGMTAKATAAALRQVPAQFTDIVVSLQGGQAPLTVFLQQGGQLKDVFGGAGAAAAALGKYVVGLINPITLAAAAVAALAYGYNQGATEVQKFNAALITTNNAAGATSEKLAGISKTVADLTGATKGFAAEAVTAFTKSGAFDTAQIERFSAVAIRAQREQGTAVEETIKAFKSLADEPLKASLKLNEGTNYLTRSVYEQIKALEEQGRVTEAAALAQSAYADASDTVASKLENNLGTIERAWRGVKDTSKSALDTLLEFGRKDSFVSQETRIANRVDLLRSGLAGTADTPAATGSAADQYRAELAQLTEVQRLLQKGKTSREESADVQREQVKVLNATVELDAVIAKNLDKKAAAEQQINALRDKYGKEAAKDAAVALKLETAIASVRAKAADKAPRPKAAEVKVDENQRELSQYIASLEKRIEKEQQLTEVQKAQNLIAKAATNDANAQVQAYALYLAAERDLEAQKKASTAALNKYNDELGKSADSVEKTVQKYKDESAAAALAISQRISLEAAINDVNIARLEERALLEYQNGNFDGLDAITREIELRKELGKEIRSKDARTETEKVAKDAASAWEKASDKIGDSITDSLMRGFESGKGFIQNLVDTAEAAFKTMVLQPTIKGVVTSGVSAVSSALGFSGSNAASAVSGISSLGGLTALGGAFGSSLSAGFGATVSSFGAATGLAIEGGLASIATGTSSAIAGGLGQIAGSLAPYALAAVGIVSVLNALKGGSYVQSLGETVATVTADKVVSLGGSGGNNDVSIGGGLNIRQTQQSDSFVSGLASAFVAAAGKLGIATQGATFGAGFNDSDGGKFAVEATVGGRTFDPGQVKYTEENLALQASRAVFFALQSSELPGYLSKVFDDINVSAASQVDIDAALNYASGLKQVRDALTETRTPLEILKGDIDKAFATLGTSAETFKTDFVAAIDQGISPDKLAQFLALGENLDTLAQNAPKAATAIDTAAESLKAFESAMEGLTTTGFDLETELLKLQGQDTTGRTRTNDLANLTKGITDPVQIAATTAQYDYNESLRLSIQTLTAIKEATLTAAESQRGFIEQYTKPIDESTASRLLGTTVVESLLGKTGDEIREMARVYVASLDSNTEAGRNAISAFEALTPAIDLFANAADNAANTLSTAITNAQSLQASAAQRYAAPLNDITAGALIGANAVASIAGKSSAEIREMAREYVEGLDAQTAAGREAIQQFQGMIPAIEYFANAADEAAASSAQAAKTAVDDERRITDTQIRDAETAKRTADAAAEAADRVRDAMKSIADTLTQTAAQIRGEIGEQSGGGYAAAQARFTVTAAQARAGDEEAAKALPQLASALVQIAERTAASEAELRSVRANTAGTLDNVAATLANRFGFQADAVLTPQGGAAVVQPVFYNSITGQAATPSDGAATLAELARITALLQAMSTTDTKMATDIETTRRVLQLVTRGGVAMQVNADAPGLLTRT